MDQPDFTSAKLGNDGVRLVALDLDGTLLGPDESVSHRSVQVLRQLRASGTKVVVATGRGPFATLHLFEGLDIVDRFVCSNGSIVYDPQSEQVIERRPLEAAVVDATVQCLREARPGLGLAWETAQGFGWEGLFAERAPSFDEVRFGEVPIVDLDAGDQVTKILVYDSSLEFEELLKLVNSSCGSDVEVSSSGDAFVEITAPGVDKASTLETLRLQWGVPRESVMAFGDSWNDIAMLRWAGVGVAMAQANAAVQAVADVVTVSNADDGVAHLLEQLPQLNTTGSA